MSFRPQGEILTPGVSEVAFRSRLLTFVRSDIALCHFEERSDEKSCPSRRPRALRLRFLTPLSRGFGMTF